MNEQSTNEHQPSEKLENLNLLIARYMGHLEVLNYAPRTLATRSGYFNALRRFLEEVRITDVQGLTGAVLHDFQRWVYYEPTSRGTARSISSQNQMIANVKGFLLFLKQEGYITHNAAQGLLYARQPRALPRNVLTPQEARQIIETPDTNTLIGYRDRTILEVLYATGIRKNEMMNLTLGDINQEEELLRINDGKGGRDRVVPLSRIACSFLESYIKGIRPELLQGNQSKRVFISLRGQPMGRNTVSAVIEKYARLSKVKKHVTCHIWRHSCATHLLKNKANLRHVQEILGHRSLATTERYLHLTITDLKEAHRKYHPREQTQQRQQSQSERQSEPKTRTSTRSKRNS